MLELHFNRFLLRAGVPTLGFDSVKCNEASKIYKLYRLLDIPQFFINAYREVPSREQLEKLAETFADSREVLSRRLEELSAYTSRWAPHFFDPEVVFPRRRG
ncbi:MAG: hypothetical protein JJU20_11515 [Opitutales bacterium]|nr:hypothetical protein [Opitutales bacterium]